MTYRVTLHPFGRSFECTPEETILEAALRNGVNLRFGCKHGGCGACKVLITAGDVDLEGCSDFALMDYEREEGYSLLCSSRALGDVTIDASGYTEAELFEPSSS